MTLDIEANMWAPGDITAPPILSDIEIERIIANLLWEAMRGNVTEDTKLAQFWFQFNIHLLHESSTEKELMSNIDGIFDAFSRFSQEKFHDLVKKGTPEDAEKFIFLINTFLKLLKIKKVYNNIPRQDFTDFSKNKDHSQLLQITIPRMEDIWDRWMSHGGSCHNWSIIFKQYFERLWIRSRIIFCNPFSNHSFTLLELKGKYYIFDPLLKVWSDIVFEVTDGPQQSNKLTTYKNKSQVRKKNEIFIWQKVKTRIVKIIDNWDDLNLEVSFETTDKKGYPAYNNQSLVSYKSEQDFAWDLDKREVEYIIFGYRLSDHRGFEIDFNREWGRKIDFEMKITEDSEELSKISISMENDKFLVKFLEWFFSRKFSRKSIQEILRNYQFMIQWKDNRHKELVADLFSEEEKLKLSSFLEKSSNYDIFISFFQNIENIMNPLFGIKNKELLKYFEKSTRLMHKRSVLKFILVWAIIEDLSQLHHEKDTYARKPKDGILDNTTRAVSSLLWAWVQDYTSAPIWNSPIDIYA